MDSNFINVFHVNKRNNANKMYGLCFYFDPVVGDTTVISSVPAEQTDCGNRGSPISYWIRSMT